jgi:hypothetical protein
VRSQCEGNRFGRWLKTHLRAPDLPADRTYLSEKCKVQGNQWILKQSARG